MHGYILTILRRNGFSQPGLSTEGSLLSVCSAPLRDEDGACLWMISASPLPDSWLISIVAQSIYNQPVSAADAAGQRQEAGCQAPCVADTSALTWPQGPGRSSIRRYTNRHTAQPTVRGRGGGWDWVGRGGGGPGS